MITKSKAFILLIALENSHYRSSKADTSTSKTILVEIQGGSVMCVCTLSSDPAHLHFSLNCLPNEEEIKKINISTYR